MIVGYTVDDTTKISRSRKNVTYKMAVVDTYSYSYQKHAAQTLFLTHCP